MEIPMPKFVIERQYLVPVYQHIVVEAANLEATCKPAIRVDIDRDTQEMDSDNARQTTITNAKVIPDALELVPGDHSALRSTRQTWVWSDRLWAQRVRLRERG
jgi:hypothetical protein